jgi:hypothetical protein
LPPEHPDSQLGQDLCVDNPSHIAFRADCSPNQGLEVEQEGLLHDVEGRNLLGELVHARHAHLDGPGRDRIDHVIVDIELSVIKDFQGECLVALFFDLLLEAG